MKFKLDENLPKLIHTTLIGLGHDAHTVAEESSQVQPMTPFSGQAMQNGAF